MPPEFEREEPTGDISGIDADALMESIESGGNTPVPMTHDAQADAPETTQTQPAAQTPGTQAPPAAAGPEFETFNWNGREIRATKDQIRQWAQMGYNYPQKAEELNKLKTQYEQEYSPYKLVDDYAKQNPDWWKHVDASFQARKLGKADGQATGPEPTQELDTLRNQISELTQFKSSFEQAQQKEKETKEDAALADEIKSIRDQFKDLDWSTVDANGFTLEAQVLKHASQTGINSFRAAFRDLKHDDLVKFHADRAKEDAQKDLQKRTKQGLLGTSPTPKTGVSKIENVKSKSYDDALREAKAELGIA